MFNVRACAFALGVLLAGSMSAGQARAQATAEVVAGSVRVEAAPSVPVVAVDAVVEVDAVVPVPVASPVQVLPPLPAAPPHVRTVQVEHSESLRALWLPGLIVLPAAWVFTWLYASSFLEGEGLAFAWLPVAGPWLMLSSDMNGQEAGVIAAGVVQGLATLAIVLGLSIQETHTSTALEIASLPGGLGTLSVDGGTLPGGGFVSARLSF